MCKVKGYFVLGLRKKKKDFEKRKLLADKTIQAFQEGKYKNLYQASKKSGISYGTLYKLVTTDLTLRRKGRKSTVFSSDEENRIAEHIQYRASIGCGMSVSQVTDLCQELLTSVHQANEDRVCRYRDKCYR